MSKQSFQHRTVKIMKLTEFLYRIKNVSKYLNNRIPRYSRNFDSTFITVETFLSIVSHDFTCLEQQKNVLSNGNNLAVPNRSRPNCKSDEVINAPISVYAPLNALISHARILPT